MEFVCLLQLGRSHAEMSRKEILLLVDVNG
jgi:hypothetical protein